MKAITGGETDIDESFFNNDPKEIIVNGYAISNCDSGVSEGNEACVHHTKDGFIASSDIASGGPNSNPKNFTHLKGYVYFSADDTSLGEELWAVNLSTMNFFLVADLESGGTGSNPDNFVVHNGKLYFTANIAGDKLCEISSPTDTPTCISLIAAIGNIHDLTSIAGGLYFCNGGNSFFVHKLNTSDGTSTVVNGGDNVQCFSTSIVTDGDFLYYLGGSDLKKHDIVTNSNQVLHNAGTPVVYGLAGDVLVYSNSSVIEYVTTSGNHSVPTGNTFSFPNGDRTIDSIGEHILFTGRDGSMDQIYVVDTKENDFYQLTNFTTSEN